MSKRRMLTPVLAAVSLFGASAVLAGVDLPVPAGCQVPVLEIDNAAVALQKEGWAVTQVPTPAMIDALGWIGMPQYFAGDSGGADMTYVFDIKRRNAMGFATLKDVPSHRLRILRRGERDMLDVLLLQWTDHHSGRFTLACSLALSVDEGADLRKAAGLNADHRDIHTLPKKTEMLGAARLDTYAYVLNVSSIRSKSGLNTASGAIILSSLNFSEGDV